VLLVHGRGETAVLNEFTAVLIYQSAMDSWTESKNVSTG